MSGGVSPAFGARFLRLNWPLVLLLGAVACIGFLMLYSVAGGDPDPWAGRQMIRFGAGLVVMLTVATFHIRFWRQLSPLIYGGAFALLVAVEFVGVTGMGAQRWIDLGPLQLQPSELMKVALVLALAAYYAWLPADRVSRTPSLM